MVVECMHCPGALQKGCQVNILANINNPGMVSLGPENTTSKLSVSQSGSYESIPALIAIDCLAGSTHLLHTPLYTLTMDRHGWDRHGSQFKAFNLLISQLQSENRLCCLVLLPDDDVYQAGCLPVQ